MVMVLLVISILISVPDESVKLSELHAAAERNWPTYSQLDRVQSQVDMQLQNVRSAWLPQVFFNASAMYYSEVTQIPFAPPGGSPPSQPHDRYSATIDVQQTLWDGGASRGTAKVTELTGKADQARVQSELYGLRERVNEAFFGVLLLDVRLEAIQLLVDELSERLASVKVRVDAGVLLQSQSDALEAERVRARQQVIELLQLRRTAVRSLELLTGLQFDDQTRFEVDSDPFGSSRPEIIALQAQGDVLDARKQLLGSKLNPQVMAVAQGGIGRPGPNFFDDTVTPFFVVGVQLRWRFFDWGVTHREKQLLELASGSIHDQISAFRRGQALQFVVQNERIAALQEQLALDDEIIRLRESVSLASARQLESGVITASEYFSVLTAYHQARLQRDIRELEYQKAEATLEFIHFDGDGL